MVENKGVLLVRAQGRKRVVGSVYKRMLPELDQERDLHVREDAMIKLRELSGPGSTGTDGGGLMSCGVQDRKGVPVNVALSRSWFACCGEWDTVTRT